MELEDLDSELENDESEAGPEPDGNQNLPDANPQRHVKPRSTAEVAAKRVAEIYELVRRKTSQRKMEKWAAEEYGITERMARKYIEKARAKMRAPYNVNRPERVNEALRHLDDAIAMAYEQKNPDALARIVAKKLEVMGDTAPARIEQTGRDGGPIQVQNAQIVIHAEADLSRFTEAERAEFQRLAESRARAIAPGSGEGEAPR